MAPMSYTCAGLLSPDHVIAIRRLMPQCTCIHEPQVVLDGDVPARRPGYCKINIVHTAIGIRLKFRISHCLSLRRDLCTCFMQRLLEYLHIKDEKGIFVTFEPCFSLGGQCRIGRLGQASPLSPPTKEAQFNMRTTRRKLTSLCCSCAIAVFLLSFSFLWNACDLGENASSPLLSMPTLISRINNYKDQSKGFNGG